MLSKTRKRRDRQPHSVPVDVLPSDVVATAWYYNDPRHRFVVVETRNAAGAYLATVQVRVPRC